MSLKASYRSVKIIHEKAGERITFSGLVAGCGKVESRPPLNNWRYQLRGAFWNQQSGKSGDNSVSLYLGKEATGNFLIPEPTAWALISISVR